MTDYGIYRPVPIARRDFRKSSWDWGWTSLRTFHWTVIGSYNFCFPWIEDWVRCTPDPGTVSDYSRSSSSRKRKSTCNSSPRSDHTDSPECTKRKQSLEKNTSCWEMPYQ